MKIFEGCIKRVINSCDRRRKKDINVEAIKVGRLDIEIKF